MPQPLPGSFTEASFEAFFDLYHSHTSDSDLAQNPIEVQRSATRRHLENGFTRKPGVILVTAFTPNPEVDGWGGKHSVVNVVMDDMPFVVDSLTAELNRLTRGVIRVLHPVLPVVRNKVGEITSIGKNPEAHLESWVEFVIPRLLTPNAHQEVEERLRGVLLSVIDVNQDWRAMCDVATELARIWHETPPLGVDPEESSEAADFLQWTTENHLTFLGYRHYRLSNGELVADPNTGLGLFKGKPATVSNLDQMSLSARQVATGGSPIVLAKGPRRSEVHRPVHPQYLAVKEFDAAGKVIGEHRFLGLLSRDAYTDSILRIPIIRAATQTVLQHSGWLPGSHSYKDLLQFLEGFPRELLLAVEPDWLIETALTALENQTRRVTQTFWHADPWGRFADVLVYVPRDIYNTAMRRRVQQILQDAFRATEVEVAVRMGESPLASLHFSLRLPGELLDISSFWSEVSTAIEASTRSWVDDFSDLAISRSTSDDEAFEFLGKWQEAFDDVYRASYSIEQAWADAQQADEIGLQVSLSLPSKNLGYRVRLIKPDTPLQLSELLPVLSAFGLQVSDEQPFEIFPAGGHTYWLHDLGFTPPIDLEVADLERLKEALTVALEGKVAVDSLSRLVLTAGLTVRSVDILRTYVSYVSQWGIFNSTAVESAVIGNPRIAALLVDEFAARLSPDRPQSVSAQLDSSIDEVTSLEEDRILRALAAAVESTARTNFYQTVNGAPRPAVVIKVKAENLQAMPAPRPYAEIWVESPRVRGVHLRFGAVARGGLRWSDRRDDLRTEVLGLVRAQVVKNAVIVPTGSKGGFFAKHLPDPANRDAWLAAGVAAYQEFINALLDVTDNRVGAEIVPPEYIVRQDGDDPYLVVAADKGTATFSDIANAIAIERGFWLGDAFASGGSVGYDHKAMGITARGAWESVRHHLALIGLDPEVDNITVVGVGDMSGDVFGNGMLLSKSMSLIAAFDHRHIFLDPNPEPLSAWQERRRLFDLPRSSWADYDSKLISAGGGVFARSEKSITVSPEVAARLGIEAQSLSPQELMTAILKAPVDLLWNGGIGTYVKASYQSNAEVGDKANDSIRVNGKDLRCRVVGEGGNLGFTQAGRIEAARNGVALNTDAIDNSAGVDTSDHEVNLKILFAQRDANRLPENERNRLLSSLTDEVAGLVLADNIAQNEVLTIAASHGGDMATVHARLIADWSATGEVDRTLEDLPADEELATRLAGGKGLTKPELSVLLAHAKIELTQALLTGSAIDEPWSEAFLFSYFPKAVQTEFREEILHHPLRREIAATVVANFVVNRAGITAAWRAQEETGAPLDEIARALALAIEIGDLEDVFAEIESLGAKQWQLRLVLLKEVRRFVDRVARWLLANRGAGATLLRDVPRFKQAVLQVTSLLPHHLLGDELERWQKQAARYVEMGAEQRLADLVAGLLDCYAALDLVELAAGEVDLSQWSENYFAISDALGGDLLLSAISRLPRADRWQTMARAALRADMYAVLAQVTSKVIASHGTLPTSASIEVWLAAQGPAVARVRSLLAEIRDREPSDIAAISVALRTLRGLVAQTGAN